MCNIKIIENGIYLPKKQVKNNELEKYLNLENGYIEKRTGIKQRYYSIEESIEDMALNAVNNIKNILKEKDSIGLIITATTSTDKIMPGISNYIQKKLDIKSCICLDILAGCSGYINAFDIAKLYITSGKVDKALVIGVDKLSQVIDKDDIGTAIVLSDGAGATLLGKIDEEKEYKVNITATGKGNEILTYNYGENLYMNGKEVYKYAVTKTIENIKELLKNSNLKLEDIKYIIPHQSNLKIIKSIASRLHIELNKMYIDIENKGNTFCASIPIALYDINKENLIQKGDKIIFLGYGGGLNTGSILIEF